jgi:ribosomal protein S18 acetylase RimI-like enzyme
MNYELCIDDYDNFKKIHLQLDNTIDFSKTKFLELLKNLELTKSYYFCIRKKSTIVGCCKFFYDFKLGNNKGFIDDLIIDKNFRNMGLGTLLIKHILNISKEHNCYIVYIITSNNNELFYNKLDFNTNNKIVLSYYI